MRDLRGAVGKVPGVGAASVGTHADKHLVRRGRLVVVGGRLHTHALPVGDVAAGGDSPGGAGGVGKEERVVPLHLHLVVAAEQLEVRHRVEAVLLVLLRVVVVAHHHRHHTVVLRPARPLEASVERAGRRGRGRGGRFKRDDALGRLDHLVLLLVRGKCPARRVAAFHLAHPQRDPHVRAAVVAFDLDALGELVPVVQFLHRERHALDVHGRRRVALHRANPEALVHGAARAVLVVVARPPVPAVRLRVGEVGFDGLHRSKARVDHSVGVAAVLARGHGVGVAADAIIAERVDKRLVARRGRELEVGNVGAVLALVERAHAEPIHGLRAVPPELEVGGRLSSPRAGERVLERLPAALVRLGELAHVRPGVPLRVERLHHEPFRDVVRRSVDAAEESADARHGVRVGDGGLDADPPVTHLELRGLVRLVQAFDVDVDVALGRARRTVLEARERVDVAVDLDLPPGRVDLGHGRDRLVVRVGHRLGEAVRLKEAERLQLRAPRDRVHVLDAPPRGGQR